MLVWYEERLARSFSLIGGATPTDSYCRSGWKGLCILLLPCFQKRVQMICYDEQLEAIIAQLKYVYPFTTQQLPPSRRKPLKILLLLRFAVSWTWSLLEMDVQVQEKMSRKEASRSLIVAPACRQEDIRLDRKQLGFNQWNLSRSRCFLKSNLSRSHRGRCHSSNPL